MDGRNTLESAGCGIQGGVFLFLADEARSWKRRQRTMRRKDGSGVVH